MDTLLKMLSITHTKNTLVGNEFVRGVSGGERKRVSILEMMATRAHVVSYDNSTRGLDASTAVSTVNICERPLLTKSFPISSILQRASE